MNLMGRIAQLFQAKTNKLVDALEDPNDLLDLSYEKMLSGLQQTKRHLADVVTERMSLARQVEDSQRAISRAEDGARMALQNGREDLARAALHQKQAEIARLESLQHAGQSIQAQEDKLAGYQRKLEERIEQFRTQKEVMKAQYQASKAQVRVNQSLTGLSNQLGNVGDAMARAKDKTDRMQARADALDAMASAGALSDPLDHHTQVERELEALRNTSAVDAELSRMKQALGQEEPAKSLPYTPKT